MRETVTFPSPWDGTAVTLELLPGRNTGTREHPCPECKSTVRAHFTFCRHYLLQRQYLPLQRELPFEEVSNA
jgi:hypothetical protein